MEQSRSCSASNGEIIKLNAARGHSDIPLFSFSLLLFLEFAFDATTNPAFASSFEETRSRGFSKRTVQISTSRCNFPGISVLDEHVGRIVFKIIACLGRMKLQVCSEIDGALVCFKRWN